MDPNTCLAALRVLADNIEARQDAIPPEVADIDASALAAGFRNLDEWISKGGFLPDAWAAGRSRAAT